MQGLSHYVDDVAWTSPNYSKNKVDQAARTFLQRGVSLEDRELARAIINNWRSSHSFPLNTMHVNLRNRVSRIDSDALVAQRIKRLPSITAKLERFPEMSLSRMQDIGGCRAVVADVRAVTDVVVAFTSSRSEHRLIREDDYVLNPQASGYRGHHLVYRYQSAQTTTWNGLSIEIQVRTRIQHAWATAVETVGTFTRQSLKSSRGEEGWLRFFALMSSAMAESEGTPIVRGTPPEAGALRAEIKQLATQLDVLNRLEVFATTLRLIETDAGVANNKYFVLELYVEPGNSQLTVRGFKNLATATEQFAALERVAEQRPSLDVVLVSVGALTSLQRAYPNYYLDTAAFRAAVVEAIEGREIES